MKRYAGVLLLIIGFFLFGSGVSHAEEASSAVQASRVWKSIQKTETGVYRDKGYIFANVVKKVDDPTTLRVQEVQVQREAGRLLFREWVREAGSRIPQGDVPYLGFAPGRLKVSGHVLMNNYNGHHIQYVFAVRQEDFDEAGVDQDTSLLVKQGKDSAAIYVQQGRQDLADTELAQVAVIEEYLPKQLSREELEVKIREIVAETGASGMKDMGKVMGAATAKLAGLAEGKVISEIVRAILNS